MPVKYTDQLPNSSELDPIVQPDAETAPQVNPDSTMTDALVINAPTPANSVACSDMPGVSDVSSLQTPAPATQSKAAGSPEAAATPLAAPPGEYDDDVPMIVISPGKEKQPYQRPASTSLNSAASTCASEPVVDPGTSPPQGWNSDHGFYPHIGIPPLPDRLSSPISFRSL